MDSNGGSFRKLLSERQGCLNLEQMESLLDSSRKQEVGAVRHIEDCPRCRSGLAQLRDFQMTELSREEEQAVDWIVGKLAVSRSNESPADSKDVGPWTAAPDPEPRSLVRRLFGASWLSTAGFAAAAALLVAALGISLMNRIGTPDLSGGTTVVRSAPIRLTDPLGELAEAPNRFSWRAAEIADHHFAVVLFEVDRTPLWTGESTTPTLVVPDDVAALLTPGRRFLWKVTLLSPNGRIVSESGVRSFSIAGARQP